MAPLRHYAAYLRPRMFPATFIMALTGWAASPTRPRQLAVCARQLALLFVVHSVLLWGGTNAYNSSQDRDAGPVNLLPNPPPLPPRLDVFGVACMALAVAVATLAGARAALLTACAIPLSIYYSIKSGKPSGKPPARAPRVRRGKDIGGVDNAIYAVGGAGSIRRAARRARRLDRVRLRAGDLRRLPDDADLPARPARRLRHVAELDHAARRAPHAHRRRRVLRRARGVARARLAEQPLAFVVAHARLGVAGRARRRAQRVVVARAVRRALPPDGAPDVADARQPALLDRRRAHRLKLVDSIGRLHIIPPFVPT